MSSSHKKQLIDNTLWVYAGKIITQILGLFATVLVIRKLPVDTYGTYTFILGLFFVYQLFITSPLKNVLLRYVPELTENGNYSVVRKLVIFSVLLAFALILMFSLLLFLFQDQFAHFFNIAHFDSHINAFFIFVLCYALKVLSETIIASFLKHPLSAKANVLVVIIRSSSYLFLLNKISVDLLLYIEAIVSLIFVAFVMRGIVKQMFLADTTDTGADVIKVKGRISRFYFLSFFSELGYGIIGKTSDHYIIAAMSSPFFVGLYGFALKIFEMFYKVLPFREFESVLKPVFFKRFSSSKDNDEINDFYMFTVKILLPLFMLPVLYFFIFGESVIVHVFDEKYLPAYSVACISLLGIFVDGFFYPLNLVIQLKERVEIILYSRVVVFFSIVAGIYFMKLYGIVGVAAATVIGELLKYLIMLFLLRKYIRVNYTRDIFIKYGAFILIISGSFLLFSDYLQSVLGWLIGSMVFFILYLIVLVNVNPLSNKDIVRLQELFNSSKVLRVIVLKLTPLLSRIVVVKRNNFI